MKSTVGRRILEETPLEIRIFVRKYAQIIARVQELMAQKGLSQKALADLMDKRPSEISKWLSGEHNLTLKSLVKLEAELGDHIFHVQPSADQHVGLPRRLAVIRPAAKVPEKSWTPLQSSNSSIRKPTESIA